MKKDSDYYSETKCPCKPCKIQTCDRDQFGPIIVEESAPIWDDASFAFSLAIATNQATFVKGRFVQVVDRAGEIQELTWRDVQRVGWSVGSCSTAEPVRKTEIIPTEVGPREIEGNASCFGPKAH